MLLLTMELMIPDGKEGFPRITEGNPSLHIIPRTMTTRISSFPMEIKVYSLNSDSWRRVRIEFTNKGLSPFRYSLQYPHWLVELYSGWEIS